MSTTHERLFTPAALAPPERFLNLYQAARAAMRNPLELWDRALYDLPYRVIRRAGRRYLEIADPALMHEVLVRHVDCFVKSDIQQRYIKPALGNGLLAAEDQAWRLQRPAAAPCFRHEALTALIPVMDRVGRASAERLAAAEGGLVDVMPEMMRATFDVVAELLLGPDAGWLDQERMAQGVTDYVETIALADAIDIAGGAKWLSSRPWPQRGRHGLQAMRDEAERVLRFRRARPVERADLLQRMLAARDRKTGAPMPELDLRDNILTFLTAGNETTALTLTWALYLIANDPRVQNQLHDEAQTIIGDAPLTAAHIERLTLHAQVIKESWRLFPPIAILQRRTVQPVRIGDVDLRPGDEVVCASYVMHRSTRLWEAPDAFDPGRFSPERAQGRHKLALMPFGAGRHICIGKPLAHMETVALLALLMRTLKLSPHPTYQPKPVMRLTVRPDRGMPLFVAGRLPPSAAPANAPSRVRSVHDLVSAN